VLWERRIWPAENPTPKPAFEQVYPAAALRAAVEDDLRKSAVLEALWGRPIDPAHLQAEMDRMARDTRQAEVLSDLFAALGNDPQMVDECLARPLLVDRLLRAWYAFDSRFPLYVRALNVRLASEERLGALIEDYLHAVKRGRGARVIEASPSYPERGART